jgi:hypothetical protein
MKVIIKYKTAAWLQYDWKEKITKSLKSGVGLPVSCSMASRCPFRLFGILSVSEYELRDARRQVASVVSYDMS